MRLLYTCIIAILICMQSTQLYAQSKCATHDFLNERLENDEKFAAWYKGQLKKETIDVETRSILSCNTNNSVIIPVAVHYNTPINCADPACLLSQAEAQIAKMNEDFAANNEDLSYYTSTLNGICPSAYPLSYAPQVGEGSCIQFCLANQNHPECSVLEDGQPAITVGQYTWTTLSAPWQGYLNLYVSNTATAGLPSGVAGVSYLPGSANGDGVFIRQDVFGAPGVSCSSGATMNTSPTFTNGRVAVHEVGHYLGLPHVFSNTDCSDIDLNPPGPFAITDTPMQENNSGPCPAIASCTDVPEDCPDIPTNFYNYMDYSNDDCMVMFTEDQSAVINYWGKQINWKSDAIYCGGTTEPYVCVEAATCSDNIKNQGEEGIDCGGPCAACIAICSTSTYDPGGLCGFYENNMSETITICPDSPGELLNITFTSFEIEEKDNNIDCWDWLKVYAGSSTSAPQIGGEFCGTSIADAPGGGYLLASAPGDCFTLEFFSDVSVVKQGWSADVVCEFILPVELADLHTKVNKNIISLHWETKSELNNLGFEVMRKEGANGSFEKIAFIEGKGNSNTSNLYSYQDKTVFKNLEYYYKLNQLDTDGHATESATVSAIIRDDSPNFVLHPNPIHGEFVDIRMQNKLEGSYRVEIYNLQGRSILSEEYSQNKTRIPIAHLATGVYIVKIYEGNNVLSVQRLLRL